MKQLSIILIIVALTAFRDNDHTPAKQAIADKILINGKIITVDSANSIAQAIAIKDGKILAVGTTADITRYKGPGTLVVDLAGKTVIPGIVDGHSHFASEARDKYANIAAPPVGPVKNIADIIVELKKFQSAKKLKPGQWINGYGYDQDQLEEKRHPVKEDLDAAFPDNPVVVTHVSGHMLVANSYALRISGIDSTTPDAPGGVIVRRPGSREPTGLLQERAMGLLKHGGQDDQTPSLQDQLAFVQQQQEYYASFGITTAQEGYTGWKDIVLLEKAAEAKALFIDIEALPGYETLDKLIPTDSAQPLYKFGILQNHLKLEGFKLIADGSPQGKTAFFSQPYLTEVPGCTGDDCRGVPVVTQEFFNKAILRAFRNNIQPFVHCNGDATIDMYIKAVKNADSVLQTTSIGRRPVVIHSQFVRDDQLDQYKALGFFPSFFTNHTFFWGDVHVRNLGEQRAYFESPVKSALNKGIIFANHTDWGVTPLNQFFLLWTSVARQSREGRIIGPDQRLTPIEGLRAITINGAWLYFEEKTKGSIEPGKLADLAILSADPLTVPTPAIKDILVLETIKEGKTIYKRS
jgi:predicted amidohydrolase YtcJ